MTYDFSADAVAVRALLTRAVQAYLGSRKRAPDEHPDVTRVELAFLPGARADGTSVPTLYVDFDVRPEPEADGDAEFGCVAELECAQWNALFFARKGERLAVTFPDGSSHTPAAGEGEYGYGIDDLLARFLAGCLNHAHADGVFARVSAPPRPLLTVTLDGNPVWEGSGPI